MRYFRHLENEVQPLSTFHDVESGAVLFSVHPSWRMYSQKKPTHVGLMEINISENRADIHVLPVEIHKDVVKISSDRIDPSLAPYGSQILVSKENAEFIRSIFAIKSRLMDVFVRGGGRTLGIFGVGERTPDGFKTYNTFQQHLPFESVVAVSGVWREVENGVVTQGYWQGFMTIDVDTLTVQMDN